MSQRTKKVNGVRCKDCDEETIQEKEKGLFECVSCGRMFTNEPKPQPDKITGNWRKYS